MANYGEDMNPLFTNYNQTESIRNNSSRLYETFGNLPQQIIATSQSTPYQSTDTFFGIQAEVARTSVLLQNISDVMNQLIAEKQAGSPSLRAQIEPVIASLQQQKEAVFQRASQNIQRYSGEKAPSSFVTKAAISGAESRMNQKTMVRD
ncbi:MAG TPA: hypothetical protein V6C96_01525, partial [Vampirovibrionales bacterium]